jgi:hypothetical protein
LRATHAQHGRDFIGVFCEDHAVNEHRTLSPKENAVAATAWFSVLMHAHSKPDHEEAARALQELKGLGIIVRFRPARESRGSGTNRNTNASS